MTDAAPSRGKVLFQAVRAFSFPASLIPCLIGAMLAFLYSSSVTWWLLPFIAISLLMLHAGSNVISDVDDYSKGVDAEGTLGGSGVLVKKLLTPKEMFRFGMVILGLAVLFGLPIIIERGPEILWFGILGLLGGLDSPLQVIDDQDHVAEQHGVGVAHAVLLVPVQTLAEVLELRSAPQQLVL